jgi:hypothetical protein
VFETAPLPFFSYAPQTPPWSSSTIEFVEQMVLFGTHLWSSSKNGLFSCKWSIMPLIKIAFDIFQKIENKCKKIENGQLTRQLGWARAKRSGKNHDIQWARGGY